MAGKSENVSPLLTVFGQCNDLIAIHTKIIARTQEKATAQQTKLKKDYDLVCQSVEVECLKHKETQEQLSKERERCQLLEMELSVVKKQLGIEKKTFEKAFGLLNTKSIQHKGDPQELITTITGLEALCDQRKQELDKRDRQLRALQMKMVAMEKAHKREKEKLEQQAKQKIYLANIRGKKFHHQPNKCDNFHNDYY